MITTVQQLTLGKHEVRLLMKDEQHIVSVDGKTYEKLDQLVNDIPEMRIPNQIDAIAIIANFMFQEREVYEVILDPTKFQTSYQQRLENDPRLKEYGIFKLSEISVPKIAGKQFVFYVEDVGRSISLKVTCPFPPASPFSYTTLPLE